MLRRWTQLLLADGNIVRQVYEGHASSPTGSWYEAARAECRPTYLVRFSTLVEGTSIR